MPGTPVIYYGDEIGMGDNYYLGDRDGVRTPMQWSIDRNAGFSRADPQRLYLPVLMDPVYGYQAVNVESQDKDPSSLLNWMRRMLAVRKTRKAFGQGALTFLYPRNRRVLAFLRELPNERVLCVVNLSRSAQAVELDLSSFRGLTPLELSGHSPFPVIGLGPYVLTLPAYGFFWFLLCNEQELVTGKSGTIEAAPELMTVVLGDGWANMLHGRERRHIENTILPSYVSRQRWFTEKGQKVVRVGIEPIGAVDGSGANHLLLMVHVEAASYFLPVSLDWGEGDRVGEANPSAIAKVRRGSRVGWMVDATHRFAFSRTVVDLLRHNGRITGLQKSEIRCVGTDLLTTLELTDMVRTIGGDQSNVSIAVGDAVVLKFYRRLDAGIQPEMEVSRFLTQQTGFTGTPAYLGTIEHVTSEGAVTTLGTAFRYVANQGDAWTAVTEGLERLLEGYRLAQDEVGEALEAFPLGIGARIGTRTAELHKALASGTSAAFGMEPVTQSDIERCIADVQTSLDRTFAALPSNPTNKFGEAAAEWVDTLLSKREALTRFLERSSAQAPSGVKIRHHGDYHLGQLLMVQDDILIIDFEGEPRRSLEDRRKKASPMRDLAGMLRSFDYAAWVSLDKLSARGIQLTDERRGLALRWRDQASSAFLSAYRSSIEGSALVPKGGIDDDLLRLFILEKALYEVGYELGSRPAWLSIPVRGIEDLLLRYGRHA
jgi:maltose alpha-D-glucosyltransferase / alpha-amylase